MLYTHKTTRCIFCRKRAVAWCGHVHDGEGDKVLAGACRQHRRQLQPDPDNFCPGCFGPMRPNAGLRPLETNPTEEA